MSDTEIHDTPIELAAPEVQQTRRRRAVPAAGEGVAKRVKIILEDNDAIPKTGLPLGHNGRFFHIRPGEPVEVPVEVLGILNDAIMSMPVQDPNTEQVVGYRDRMRYPYRYVS